jgi:hypothetical protein
VVAAVFGSLLVISRPVEYFANADFRVKFVIMAVAGLNMAVFQFITGRDIAKWDAGAPAPAGRFAGAVSLVCWIAIVYFARKTGFTLVQGGA